MFNRFFHAPKPIPSVLVLLICNPEHFPKLYSNSFASKTDFVSDNNRVRSSAYCVNLNSCLLHLFHLFSYYWLTLLDKISTPKVNKYGDKGSPCLTPRLTLKYFVVSPLLITQLHMSL